MAKINLASILEKLKLLLLILEFIPLRPGLILYCDVKNAPRWRRGEILACPGTQELSLSGGFAERAGGFVTRPILSVL